MYVQQLRKRNSFFFKLLAKQLGVIYTMTLYCFRVKKQKLLRK